MHVFIKYVSAILFHLIYAHTIRMHVYMYVRMCVYDCLCVYMLHIDILHIVPYLD